MHFFAKQIGDIQIFEPLTVFRNPVTQSSNPISSQGELSLPHKLQKWEHDNIKST